MTCEGALMIALFGNLDEICGGLLVAHDFPGYFWSLCKEQAEVSCEFAFVVRGWVPGTFCWVVIFD
jgi:hypothetical protein